MKIIKEDELSIPDIVSALRRGETIVYPTETCYGLGCDALNPLAVEKIFEIKKRQRDKPVLVVAADESMIVEYVDWSKELVNISEHYWPGALTAVVDVKSGVELPRGVMSNDGTLAFRITDHHLASEISAGLGRPLFSTSANFSVLESPYDIESVLNMFQHADIQPDIIIDAGTLQHKNPSTVVRIKNGKVNVLRQGEVIVKI